MPIDFYYTPGSAPCRSVLMAAKALGVELNLKPMNLMAGEHLTPEFLKLNPQHTVPTMVDADDGFVLFESRAILIYLQQKYGESDLFYPNDLQQRARVDQRLMFDAGTLYPPLFKHLMLIYKKKPFDSDLLANIRQALEFLDIFLSQSIFVAGDRLTLADFTIFANVSTLDMIGFQFDEFKNIVQWYESLKTTIPGHDLNQTGLDIIKRRIQSNAEFKWMRNKTKDSN